MEFLVRLEDKINTQVFCLNPAHKGKHMDEVSFKDETFEAPCPVCGSNEYLYRKNNEISKKGNFITFKEDGWSWGSNELKHYGIARIDCTYEQAKKWCETVRDEQAEADVRQHEMDCSQRVKKLTDGGKTKEEIKADLELHQIEENRKLAENTAAIAVRHRKRAFDFEKVLTPEQLKNWNNMDEYSEIITISEQDKSQVKEIQWH